MCKGWIFPDLVCGPGGGGDGQVWAGRTTEGNLGRKKMAQTTEGKDFPGVGGARSGLSEGSGGVVRQSSVRQP